MRRGVVYVAGLLAVILPAGVSAKSLMAINFQTGVTQSAGYTYVGLRSVFSGIVGASYERALAASRYNKGLFTIVVGYQPEQSTLFGFVGGVIPLGMKAGVYDLPSRGAVRLFLDVGGKVRVWGSEQFGLCLTGELRYHLDPGVVFAPAGLSPSIGVLAELGRL
ncbi:MAG: hypothetical protein ABIK22_05510 [candidate division WOR-3 bacterium]